MATESSHIADKERNINKHCWMQKLKIQKSSKNLQNQSKEGMSGWDYELEL